MTEHPRGLYVMDADYFAVCVERDAACKDANEKAFRCDALSARVAQLETLLRELAPDIEWGSMSRWKSDKPDGQRFRAALGDAK